MKITFSARHFDASDKLKEFAKSELDGISKHADNSPTGEIILDESGDQKTVDMRLTSFGRTFVSKMVGKDFYKTIPAVVNKLEKQLKAVKSKVVSRG